MASPSQPDASSDRVSGAKQRVFWLVKFDDKRLRLADFPVGIIDDIASTLSINWFTLIDAPLNLPTMAGARLLLSKGAALLGVEAPRADMTVRQLIDDHFDTESEDLPADPDAGPASGVDPTG